MNASASISATSSFYRFVWKEYRTLRSFWLALAGLAIAEQCVSKLVFMPGEDLPLWLFSSALGAAALYAIGASAVVFSTEHEERTFDFLSALPTTWPPLFFGKLAIVAASAGALVLLLVATGGLIGGGVPSWIHARDVVAALGFAIVEGIVWGTVCSLRFRQPLVAALLAITATAIATQTVTSLTVAGHSQALDWSAYREALPARLALVAVVFAADVWLARHWLPQDGRGAVARSHPRRQPAIPAKHFGAIGRQGAEHVRPVGPAARILWQSWRENRWLLLIPLVVSLALWVLIAAATGLLGVENELAALITWSSLLILPTLYGAFAFYTDQRQRQYQFFAEHGIGGRHVWLLRNAVWLAALVGVLALLSLAPIVTFAWMALQQWNSILDGNEYWRLQNWTAASGYEQVGAFLGISRAAYLYVGKVLLAPLAAFAVGQFCSMVLRSPVLAAFLSLVLSVVLAAWMFVVFAWQLNAWLFVAPIIVGFFLTTWLRAPDWIAGRNTPRAWLKPLAAAALPLIAMGLCLPAARLAQLPAGAMLLSYEQLAGIQPRRETSISEKVDRYEQAARLAGGRLDDDPLEPWYKYSGMGMSNRDNYRGIDVSSIPENERQGFERAKAEHERLATEASQQALDLLVQAAGQQEDWLQTFEQPGRWFDFQVEQATRYYDFFEPSYDPFHEWGFRNQKYTELDALLTMIAASADSFDELLAGLTLCARMRAGQPVHIFVEQLQQEKNLLKALARWASADDRTPQELHDAQNRLRGVSLPDPKKALWVDAALVRDTIQGDLQPLIFGQPHVRLSHHLAWLSSQLPWERERAIRALDVLVALDAERIESIEEPLHNNASRIAWQTSGAMLRARIAAARHDSLLRFRRPDYLAARTSYLASMEYEARVSIGHFLKEIVDAEVRRRALGLQLALIGYLREHGEYPASLEQFMPEHIVPVPFDPYTGEAFRFEREGLSLPTYGNQEAGAISAGTPILWSPGVAGARFELGERSVSTKDPEAEPEREQIFRLVPDYMSAQTWGWSEGELIFPLPIASTGPAAGDNDRVE